MNELRKMCYLYPMEFYSPKKNEILSFASKWIEVENVFLSKVSQTQKAENHMFSLIYIDIYRSIYAYKPKTNAIIVLDMGHTLRGECSWEE
jgi:hypothetical protein